MRASRLLPLFGVLAVAFVVIAFVVIGNTPDVDDSIAKITNFYRQHDTDVSAGGVLLMAAAAAFLAWAVQVRSVLFLREGGSATRTTLGLVGAVLFAIGMTTFAGLNIALGDSPDKYEPATLQVLNTLSQDLFTTLAVGALLTLLGNGLAIIKTRAFPVWLGWVSFIGGLFIFTPLFPVPFFALAVLIVVSSVMLAMRPEAPAQPTVT
jgi:hypothetical protein